MVFCKCCKSLIDATNASIQEVEARYTKLVVENGVAVPRCWCPICASNPANAAECAQHCVDENGKKVSMFARVDGIHASKSIVYTG